MDSNDTWKAKFGLYEWLVMQFDLANAPTTSIWLINAIFHAYIGCFIMVYLDNIIILVKHGRGTYIMCAWC